MITFENYNALVQAICPVDSLAVVLRDNGENWGLELYHRSSLKLLDFINLDHNATIDIDSIEPVLLNLMVVDANRKTLREYLNDFNTQQLEYRKQHQEWIKSICNQEA